MKLIAVIAAFIAPAAVAYALIWLWVGPMGNELLPMYAPQNVPWLLAQRVLLIIGVAIGSVIFTLGLLGEIGERRK